MIGERYALSFGNHARYIAVQPGSDNELGLKEKGAEFGPLMHSAMPQSYSLAAASAGASGPLVACASMRAFLPRKPRR